MSKTDADLSKEVLREIGLINGNDEPQAEDDSYAKQVSADEHEALPSLNVRVNWVATDIPDSVYRPLVRYLATCIGPRYGFTVDENEREARLRRLRAAAALSYVGSTVRFLDY